MYKQEFIVDTDSLIKLTKSGIIKAVCKNFKFTITEEIYDESVVKGKGALHKDAFEIENLINRKFIKIKKTEVELEAPNLGKGELSLYALHKKTKATIVPDDNTFINFLKRENAEFMMPANFITLLKKLNKINPSEALNYLNNLKPYIKPKVYLKIKDDLEELK